MPKLSYWKLPPWRLVLQVHKRNLAVKAIPGCALSTSLGPKHLAVDMRSPLKMVDIITSSKVTWHWHVTSLNWRYISDLHLHMVACLNWLILLHLPKLTYP